MAISKIIYMKDCGNAYHGKHLKVAIDYITAKEKTQNGRMVAAVNCQPDFAFEQMKETKQKFGKNDKRQGYHLILSFVEGEVDAHTAFEITRKFVKEYLGSDYEAIYAVHDNTNHIHSHIVYNSVSFRTGKKYRYEKGDWAKDIQPITNRLCEEYGLSTIELEENKERPEPYYKEWRDYRGGGFVWSDMIKRDLDACILLAPTFEDFLDLIGKKGYEVKLGKYLAIKPPGMTRFKRLKTLGEEYREECIRSRIFEEDMSSYRKESIVPQPKIIYCNIRRFKKAKFSGLQKRYFARLYRVRRLKKQPYSKVWKYKDEIKKMHQLQEQYLFLVHHDIHSIPELATTVINLTDKKKKASLEKSRVFKARAKYKSLFTLCDSLKELKECENSYQNGDPFFEEEHWQWRHLEKQLLKEGYSFDTFKLY